MQDQIGHEGGGIKGRREKQRKYIESEKCQ